MTTPRIVLIAAVARNGVIGRHNDLPWHLPQDMRFFRDTTMGHPVLMGRRNWDSIPAKFRPLPGRRNLVMTRDATWRADGAERVASLDEAVNLAADAPTLFVIGGAEVYRLALPIADELILTEIDADVPGDVHFPDWNRDAFEARAGDTLEDGPDRLVCRRMRYRRIR